MQCIFYGMILFGTPVGCCREVPLIIQVTDVAVQIGLGGTPESVQLTNRPHPLNQPLKTNPSPSIYACTPTLADRNVTVIRVTKQAVIGLAKG